ncbi:MAG TPA: carbon storage regulator [Bryobacteraceae bacterium]|nr:carbon storage regulator [Bryobacteraceae bacterium]
MLVLRRRAGQSVLIGDDIEIELLELTAHGAKLGIRAPRETVVLRKELKITREQNARAAQGFGSCDPHKTFQQFSRVSTLSNSGEPKPGRLPVV